MRSILSSISNLAITTGFLVVISLKYVFRNKSKYKLRYYEKKLQHKYLDRDVFVHFLLTYVVFRIFRGRSEVFCKKIFPKILQNSQEAPVPESPF